MRDRLLLQTTRLGRAAEERWRHLVAIWLNYTLHAAAVIFWIEQVTTIVKMHDITLFSCLSDM